MIVIEDLILAWRKAKVDLYSSTNPLLSNNRVNIHIAQALTKLFDRHRIVVWCDAKQELRDDFEVLSLSGVEKLGLTNNEYRLKYRLLCEQPEQKFLFCHEGKMLSEMEVYEYEVHYPLATCSVASDLDDGVKVNYPKLGAALKKIPGLDAKKD